MRRADIADVNGVGALRWWGERLDEEGAVGVVERIQHAAMGEEPGSR
jgi:hypothetical protein